MDLFFIALDLELFRSVSCEVVLCCLYGGVGLLFGGVNVLCAEARHLTFIASVYSVE